MRGRFLLTRLTPWTLGVLLATLGGGLTGCSGSQADDENLNSEDNNNADLGNDDAHDGNAQENFLDDDKGGDKADSADVNSATGDTAAADPLDSTLDGAKPDGGTAPANAAAAAPPAGPDGGAANSVAAAKGGGGGAPPKAGDTTPVAGGRVRYVKEGGVQAVSAPNGGTPVMTIEQGEHPVTWEENGFLRISSGLYVPVDSLSDKGVPRPTSQNIWQAH